MLLTVQPRFPQLSDQAEGLLIRVLLGASGRLDPALLLCVFIRWQMIFFQVLKIIQIIHFFFFNFAQYVKTKPQKTKREDINVAVKYSCLCPKNKDESLDFSRTASFQNRRGVVQRHDYKQIITE